MYPEIALIAYVVDMIFGEFRYIRHPVVLMGSYIEWFEEHLYRDSIWRGATLSISLILIVYTISFLVEWLIVGFSLPYILTVVLLGTIASTAIASNMLYQSVKDIITNPANIKYLVSRDTHDLKPSDINKAAIETYAENLSDGVIAPLLYLLLFGITGAFVYKAINTLDSMIGYRSDRYEKFGKFAARLDDIANYIPAKLTALLISILMLSREALSSFSRYGARHDSPNAGYPISAMAIACDLKLGGETAYLGKIKAKPYFGDGRVDITKEDIINALSIQKRLDITIIIFLVIIIGDSR